MEKERLNDDSILKIEVVGYLKSRINLQLGTIKMTAKRIFFAVDKTGPGGLGILGSLFKNKIEKSGEVFNVGLDDIKSVTQGKHGIQNNVLEITTKQNCVHRIIVKNYQEWENAIKQKMNN